MTDPSTLNAVASARFAGDAHRAVDRRFGDIRVSLRAENRRRQCHLARVGQFHLELDAVKFLPLGGAVVAQPEAVLVLAARAVRLAQHSFAGKLDDCAGFQPADRQGQRRGVCHRPRDGGQHDDEAAQAFHRLLWTCRMCQTAAQSKTHW